MGDSNALRCTTCVQQRSSQKVEDRRAASKQHNMSITANLARNGKGQQSPWSQELTKVIRYSTVKAWDKFRYKEHNEQHQDISDEVNLFSKTWWEIEAHEILVKKQAVQREYCLNYVTHGHTCCKCGNISRGVETRARTSLQQCNKLHQHHYTKSFTINTGLARGQRYIQQDPDDHYAKTKSHMNSAKKKWHATILDRPILRFEDCTSRDVDEGTIIIWDHSPLIARS